MHRLGEKQNIKKWGLAFFNLMMSSLKQDFKLLSMIQRYM